jgi:hypothetical protein
MSIEGSGGGGGGVGGGAGCTTIPEVPILSLVCRRPIAKKPPIKAKNIRMKDPTTTSLLAIHIKPFLN